jgi:hypothetical protein
MTIISNTYTGDGSTVIYSISFPYIESSDVKATLNGIPTTAFTFVNASTIQFGTAPALGVVIQLFRRTNDASLAATFSPGSTIRSQDLNDNFTQNLFVTQEAKSDSESVVQVANIALSNSATAINTANSASSVANGIAGTASNALTTATAATVTAQDAVLIATQAAAPLSTIQILEPHKILINASRSIGVPGTIPFGVGPVIASGLTFSGISQSDYYPVHLSSGSYC